MSTKTTADVIEDVLCRYAQLQVNLESEAARKEIARTIASAVEDHIPGMMSLSELVSSPHRS